MAAANVADGPSQSCEYEVKCPQTWAWYPANISDYDVNSQRFLIKYPDDWKQQTWEIGTDIRPAGAPFGSTWRPSKDERCECKAKAEENEPFGWWGCQVKSLADKNGNTHAPGANSVYAFIQFDGWPEEHNEMLELEYLRPRNTAKSIISNINSSNSNHPNSNNNNSNNNQNNNGKMTSISKKVMDVPAHAISWVQDVNNLRNLKKRLLAIEFNEAASKLILIGTSKRVDMATGIVELQFGKQKMLHEKKAKLQRAEDAVTKSKEREAKACKTTFQVHELLSGYLITRDRMNSKEKKVKGLVRIQYKNGVCEIACDTQEALSEAVDMLQIVAKKIILPKREMAPIIGKRGEDIRKLKQDCDVIRIISWSRFPEEYLRLKSRHAQRNPSSRPNTADTDDKQEGGKGGKRGKKRSNQNTNDDDGMAGYTGPDDLYHILKYYGVKLVRTRYEETRVYPEKLENEIHDFFKNEDEDVIELLSEEEKKDGIEEDALVIIGKKSNVNQCISMIMLQLNHIRKINSQKSRIRQLHAKLRDIKGYALSPRDYDDGYENGRDRRDRRGDRRDGRDGRTRPPQTNGMNANDANNNNNNNEMDRNDNRNGEGGKRKKKRKNKRGQDRDNRGDDGYDSKEESSFGQRGGGGGGQSQPKTNISVRRRLKLKKDNKDDKDENEAPETGGKTKGKKRNKKNKNKKNKQQQAETEAAEANVAPADAANDAPADGDANVVEDEEVSPSPDDNNNNNQEENDDNNDDNGDADADNNDDNDADNADGGDAVEAPEASGQANADSPDAQAETGDATGSNEATQDSRAQQSGAAGGQKKKRRRRKKKPAQAANE